VFVVDMMLAFAILLVVHGLIHLLGVVKAFGLADLPQVTQPISPALGLVWLLTAVLFIAAAAALFIWPRGWWVIGAGAVAVSMVLIDTAWSDARFGTIGNAIAIIGVVFGGLAQGPFSLRAAYDRDVARDLARVAPAAPIEEADLTRLPPPVQRYLRTSGVVGQPRVRNFYVRMHGRIRSGPDARWMPLTAEQYSFADEPARFFYLDASMFAVPVQGYHRYVAVSGASMTVKAAALVPVVHASGPEMSRSETVTLFNDMCVMAPATLIGRSIEWEPVDARTARAAFTNAGHTIRAELTFNEAGELTNFSSDDRSQISPDGKSMRRVRWSTPLGGYRSFGPVRLASRGEGRWHEAERAYAYIELILDEVRYNLTLRSADSDALAV
jgi:hypothetical protein